MRLLSDTIRSRDNNFNLVRLIAAWAVIVTHSYNLCGIPRDPFTNLLGRGLSHLAVDVFFFVSGLLVTRSLLERNSLLFFLSSRFLRIFPGLIAAILFCALIVGPIYTKLNLSDYFLHADVYSFIFNNIFLFDGVIQYGLPGVFTNNSYPTAVNGSLWTLPWELYMYISLVGFGILGLLRHRSLAIFVSIVFITAYVANGLLGFIKPSNFHAFYALHFLGHFYTGALFYFLCSYIYLSYRIVTCLAIFIIFNISAPISIILYPVTLGYFVLVFAYTPTGWLRRYNSIGDYSYGTYIYAFPVQQALAASITEITPLLMIVLTTLITLPMAALSWHFVELPALKIRFLIGDLLCRFSFLKA